MTRLFKKYFWKTLYYDVKWGVINLFTHFKVVWRSRPWDFNYPLAIFKFKLEQLSKSVENGWEEEISRDKKVKDMKRCIELINHKLEDDYIDRVGGLNSYKYSLDFEPYEYGADGEVKTYTMIEPRSQKEIEEDESAYHKAMALESREWDELWTLVKNGAQGWWD